MREGNRESRNRLPELRNELSLADAGYCSACAIEYVKQTAADVVPSMGTEDYGRADGKRLV
jgi:hypothetical protein